MRPDLVIAVERGAVLALGTHKLFIGGATVSADVFQVPGETDVHLEIDCTRQTMETILGAVQVDGVLSLTMPRDMFEKSVEIVRSKSPRLAAAAAWLTGSRPLLTR